MSYSIDANILLYASDSGSPHHAPALRFLESCAGNPDLLCLSWQTLMSYQRIATHPAIFAHPLTPSEAWENISQLLALDQVRLITERPGFASDYARDTAGISVRGNLVPDAHLAVLLRQHGVQTIHTNDADFRKFPFLRCENPFET